MIQLLFLVVGAEAGMVVLLLVKNPLRRLILLGLDRLKRPGRSPIAARTVGATASVVLLSGLLSSMLSTERRAAGDEDVLIAHYNPTDQALCSRHLLEASLMGLSLFIALVIDRVHHYIGELRAARRGMEAETERPRAAEERHKGASEEALLKARDREIDRLKARIAELESESEERLREAMAADENATALRKQSEGFLLEYGRLLEDNQNLRTQLKSLDRRLSRSGTARYS